QRSCRPVDTVVEPQHPTARHVRRGHAKHLGEPAGVEVRGRVGRAERVVPPSAHLAGVARNMMVGEHSVALGEARHSGAHSEHSADRLVAQDPGGPVVAAQLLKVRAADTARREAYGDLPLARGRLGLLVEPNRARAAEPAYLHAWARAARIAASRISMASSI